MNARRIRQALMALAMAVCTLVSAAALNYSLDAVMNGILAVETGGNAFAINDNTTRRSYKFGTKDEAVKMANMLLSLNHNIDMGKFQINSFQLSRGWKVENLFDEAFNRSAAETIYNEWLTAAKRLYGDVELAYQRAIAGYNSGGTGLRNGNVTYLTKVLRAMGIMRAPIDTEYASSKPPKVEKQLSLSDDDADEDDDLASEEETRRAPEEDVSVKVTDILFGALMLLLIVLLIKLLGPLLARSFLGNLLSMGTGTVKKLRQAMKEE